MHYILAVSGGVDSMALLDMVATEAETLPPKIDKKDIIVAHFRHNIRNKAAGDRDEEIIEKACARYGLKCVVGESHDLGENSSEEQARTERYAFLNKVGRESGNNYVIVTAHHQDDLLETALMNLIRGTGWRGLAPMANSSHHLRPLLGLSKAEITAYAINHGLAWQDDATNFSPHYFRNRVRDMVAGLDAQKRRQLIELIGKQMALREEIEPGVKHLADALAIQTKRGVEIRRYALIMLDADIALELLRYLTRGRLTRPQLIRLLLFTKTAQPHKQMVWKDIHAQVTTQYLLIC